MTSLVASAVRTANGNSGVLPIGAIDKLIAAVFQLTVSAVGVAASDTLNVYVQHSVDGGTTYDDFVSFTQVLGNGGAKKFVAAWRGDIAPTTALKPPADASLAAGVQQGPVGGTWRVKWVIVDGGGNDATFTFAVDANLIRK